MTPEYDLFTYPQVPGHRGVDTQIDAAQKVQRSGLKWQCYKDIKRHLTLCGDKGATSYEMADALNYKHSFLQPRISEMLLNLEVRVSKERRQNKDGNSVRVYII